MAKLHVRKGDTVLVIAGKDNGKTGKVLSAMPSENAVIVEGVNFVYKHKKARNAQEKGGIVKTEGKINASNVQVVCPDCKKATRIANKVDENGKHVRTCKHCGASLDKEVVVKKATKKAEAKVAEASKAKKATTKTATKKAAPKTTSAATKKSTTTKSTKSVVRKTGDK